MKKMKELLSEVFDESPKVDRHKVIEGVRNYGIVGKTLYNNSNIMEVAKQLADIAEQAHHHILGENDDWFDKVSVNRNMKSLKGSVVEFQKTAKEAHMLNQRLTGLYEDIGHVLNRYYDIDEVMAEVDKGDMDNDGVDEPDDEEYMDNKDKAIKKAMKKETKEAPGELDNNDDEHEKDKHGSQYDNVKEDYKSDELKKAMKETADRYNSRPIRKLSDIGNVSSVKIPALGDLVPGKK